MAKILYLEMGTLSWIVGAGTKYNHECPYKGRWARGDFRHKRRSQCDPRGKDGMLGPQAKECQQPPAPGRSKELILL